MRKFILPSLFVLLLYVSCSPGEVADLLGSREESDTITITALIPESAAGEIMPAAGKAAVSQLVLESGNHWTKGVPGFGENALSAFTGEYRIPGMAGTVWVWLTREFLYYDGWTARAGITGFRTLQKTENDGLAAAVTLNDSWTIVILLPPGISAEEEDRLITTLAGRFSGFSGQYQDISLPAFIPY